MSDELLYACDGVVAGPATSEALRENPVDTAIGRCEKLRRILELEEWIAASCDDALLSSSCRTWRAEREQLLAQLDLSH